MTVNYCESNFWLFLVSVIFKVICNLGEIAEAQQQDNNLKEQADKEGFSTQLTKDIKLLCKDGNMVIPRRLQQNAVA